MAIEPENPKTAFDDSPEGWAQRWALEIESAEAFHADWKAKGKKIVKRFLDERDQFQGTSTRWNLFTSNVQLQRALLFGNAPRVDVSRRYADAGDDPARVGAVVGERLLNSDIESDGDTYEQSLDYSLSDRLLVGVGMNRLVYVAKFETVEKPAMTDPTTGAEVAAAVTTERKTYENVEVDYVHWDDVLWNPCRVWSEVRYIAYKNPMAKDELEKRFPEHAAHIPLDSTTNKSRANGMRVSDPWDRADVYEIWDKDRRKVYWFVKGYGKILDQVDDPLELEGFFPSCRPMFANLTTDSLTPRADFILAQDLYNEIDLVSTRLTGLETKLRLRGAYDKTAAAIGRLLAEGDDGALVPVDNWPKFQDSGGLRGLVEWMPLEALVGAIMALRQIRTELIEAVHQITGMSDLMRGQASSPGATATEQRIKGAYGSVRIRAMQDEFARFASDTQKLKFEIICKHFDAATILARCNCEYTADAKLVPAAIALLKSPRAAQYRIEVKPETVSFTDFGQLRSERTEVVTTIASFFSAVGPLAVQMPEAKPFFLQILQWMIAGLRGSGSIEGVIDQAVSAALEAEKMRAANPQQEKPNPQVQLQMMKNQGDLAKIDAETQADLVKLQAETAANNAKEQQQAFWNTQEAKSRQAMQFETHAVENAGAPTAFPRSRKAGGF